MHFYGILRGRPKLVEWVKDNMQDVFLPAGNGEYIQLVPRKVELVELVFPEKYLPEVYKTVTECQEMPKKTTINMGKDTQAMLLRQALGLKKIPKMDLSKYDILKCRGDERVMHSYAHFTPIGIKEDKKKNGVELL